MNEVDVRRLRAEAHRLMRGHSPENLARKCAKGSEAWGVCPVYAEGDCKFGTDCNTTGDCKGDCLRITPQHRLCVYADTLRKNMAEHPENYFVVPKTRLEDNMHKYTNMIVTKNADAERLADRGINWKVDLSRLQHFRDIQAMADYHMERYSEYGWEEWCEDKTLESPEFISEVLNLEAELEANFSMEESGRFMDILRAEEQTRLWFGENL